MRGGASIRQLLGVVAGTFLIVCAAPATALDNASATNSASNVAIGPPVSKDQNNAATQSPPAAQSNAQTVRLTLDQVDLVHNQILARLETDTSSRTLKLSDADTAARLLPAHQGDFIDASVDQPGNPTKILKIARVLRPVDVIPRLFTFGGVFSALFLFALAVSSGRPARFLIGVDRRFSNSQTQLALWFAAMATSYGATVVLRVLFLGGDFISGVGVTANLTALSGLSALSFGGAKAITINKVDTAADKGAPPVKTPAAKANLIKDLFCNDDGYPDLGDFQMILITIVAATLFLVTCFHFLGALELSKSVTLPDVDTTLLASFGIGQGAYLAKKAASTAGQG